MPGKEEKTELQKTEERLSYKKKSAWDRFNEKEKKEVMSFSEDYKDFLRVSKTERKASINIINLLEEKGFKDISSVKKAKPGDKIYKQVKSKSIVALVVGKNMEDLRIVGSHIDSPRLDLKPFPVAEESGFATLRTHYYGGIKKYQWVNYPMELHGVVYTPKGKKIDIDIGSSDDDPKLIISDLLPHLAKKQMEKTPKTVVEGEELNLIAGNMPVCDEKIKDKVRLTLLQKLEKEYGMTEEDFAFAELEAVPAVRPTDIGLDRSLIGAYAHDDKVCAYTSLRAILDVKNPDSTAISFFADKEEIGSLGNTGAESMLLGNLAHDYVGITGVGIPAATLLERARSISADVTAGVNPNYKDVHDLQNASFIGHGVSIEKYGGSGGKYSSNDTHAEYLSFIRDIVQSKDIPWQSGELGKIDLGGGGTIAMFMSRYGMDCIDIGPCVLGMHSPCELISKADIYSAYMLYKEFFNR